MLTITNDQLGLYGSLLTGVGTVLSGIYYGVKKFTTLEIKVDLLFDHIMRKSIETAIREGVATMNSPLVVKEEKKHLFDGLYPELIKIYKKVKRSTKYVTDKDLFIAIDKELGERIMREIALPNGISVNACVLAAVHICKDGGV